MPYEALEAEGEFYLYEICASPAAFEDDVHSDHVRRYMASVPSVSGQALSNLVQLTEVDGSMQERNVRPESLDHAGGAGRLLL